MYIDGKTAEHRSSRYSQGGLKIAMDKTCASAECIKYNAENNDGKKKEARCESMRTPSNNQLEEPHNKIDYQ